MNGRAAPSLLERLLRPFADVRAGEGATALLLAANVFLILTASYVLKVLREALILTGGGATRKSYAAAGQALLLIVLVPLYGALAARLPRRPLINTVTAFFVLCLAAFFVLSGLGVPLGVPFYLWMGVFNLMVLAQFWSFANDVYTTDEGKRLFPLVAFGGSVGAVVGSEIPRLLMATMGVRPLFLVAALLLLVAVALTNYVDSRERARTEGAVPEHLASGLMPAATGQFRAATGEFRTAGQEYRRASGQMPALRPQDLEPPAPEPAPAAPGAFGLVFRSRYLFLIALLMLLLNSVNSTGEYVLGQTVTDLAPAAAARSGVSEQAIIGGFYANYFAGVNLLALFIQLFVVSRVLKFGGVRAALLVLPTIALAGYALMAFVPILAAIRWAKTAENATDYSLNKTTLNVLFLPTTREEKYSAKQAIDGFFVRMGDVTSAGLVYAGTHLLLLGTRQFALVNMVLVVAWITLAVAVGRRYGVLASAVA